MANEEYCKQLKRRIAELEKENAELRAQLGLSDTKAAATAFGKTVIAANLISQRKVNTLVLVHTQALMNQWKTSLSEFWKSTKCCQNFQRSAAERKNDL